MTMASGFASTEDDEERITCLVEQGFTPALARSALMARSKDFLPLTIWLVDNSSSMTVSDGKRLLETSSQNDVRVARCTRWEELQEAVDYHARLAALLGAPTRFVLLNDPSGLRACPQEMSIAERGSKWIHDDLKALQVNFSTIEPGGVTPLTTHLHRINRSIQHMREKIVLVLATDGRPTDSFGYSSAAVDRAFENALREIQSKAWVVVRLCTNEESILEYYQKLDDQMELSLEVLDDYLDEAKEVHTFNPWLTYSLSLHRCREMGMSCHSLHRWLDWLDERAMTRAEIYQVVQILGVVDWVKSPNSLDEDEEWLRFCDVIDKEQKRLASQRNEATGKGLPAFMPWNPIRKRATPWIDVVKLKQHGKKSSSSMVLVAMIVVVMAIIAGVLRRSLAL